MARHLVLSGIDGHIEMIALAVVVHHRVALQHLCQRQHLWLGLGKDFLEHLVVALRQLGQLARLRLEPQQVLCLFLDVVATFLSDVEGVVHHAEIGRHRGGVGIIDGVALRLEHSRLGVVKPYALHQALGLATL